MCLLLDRAATLALSLQHRHLHAQKHIKEQGAEEKEYHNGQRIDAERIAKQTRRKQHLRSCHGKNSEAHADKILKDNEMSQT